MIDNFSGEFSFLSNFHIVNIEYRGIEFISSENAYQFAKIELDSVTKELEEFFSNSTPGQSKRMGRKVNIRDDWDKIKLSIMDELLRIKFKNIEMKHLLLATETETLIEGNTWGDTFWGVCNGRGSNHLGKLLMKIRKELQQQDLDEIF